MIGQERDTIIEVLCSLALSEHMGDVRDAELKLWNLIGIYRPEYESDSAWTNTKNTLKKFDIPLPCYFGSEDDDDDED